MLKEVVKKIIKFLELVDRYCLLLLGEAQRVSHRFRGGLVRLWVWYQSAQCTVDVFELFLYNVRLLFCFSNCSDLL